MQRHGQLRIITGGSNGERLTNVGTTSFMPAAVSLSSLLPPTVSLHSYHSLIIYECCDTVEQRMIPGVSNDETLTDVDTHNCYMCKVT